ncbi:hypothetical protein [Morganella morganii]|uniref:hypothetical protein n=1 Tax=Morganella morganii TaxID=582 RepID=UPI0031B51FEE
MSLTADHPFDNAIIHHYIYENAVFDVFLTGTPLFRRTDPELVDHYTFDDFMSNNGELKMTLRTFQRGLSELESRKIIAKTMRKGFYYINPNFVFNGDRIAFTTLIEKTTLINF